MNPFAELNLEILSKRVVSLELREIVPRFDTLISRNQECVSFRAPDREASGLRTLAGKANGRPAKVKVLRGKPLRQGKGNPACQGLSNHLA